MKRDEDWLDRHFGWVMLAWLLVWLAIMAVLGFVAFHFIAKWW